MHAQGPGQDVSVQDVAFPFHRAALLAAKGQGRECPVGDAVAEDRDVMGVLGLLFEGVAHRGDTEYLKALPDGKETNNLSSLPTVR